MKSCDVGALTIEARVFHQPPRTTLAGTCHCTVF